MKNTDIAQQVFAAMDAVPLTELTGGEVAVPIADIAGLSLVPWFCDASVQWALRLTKPGTALKQTLLKKVKGSFITTADTGAVLVGVPGDGIEPSTFALVPLAESIGQSVQPGMVLELATANLGVVKRDRETTADLITRCGNQRYLGSVDGQGRWSITHTTPALATATLRVALDCGRMVARDGPWPVTDKSEAYAILMQWLRSPEANVNPAAVQRFIAVQDGAFTNSDPGMTRKLCGLGLGFFRHRLAAGPFSWPDPGPSRYPVQQLEEIARAVVG